MTATIVVNPPRYCEFSVDSPEAFDDAARAALTFASNGDTGADSAEGPRNSDEAWTDRAAFKIDGSGWHMGRDAAHAWPERLGEPVAAIHIGDVLVCQGEPENGNPYGVSLCGSERKEGLRAFKNGKAPKTYTYWYGPASSGARRIEAHEVNWETSGIE
jgi:hypothetical protein